MKTKCSQFRPKWHQAARSTVAALAVFSSAGLAVADDLNFSTFDSGISGIGWQNLEDLCHQPHDGLGCVAGRRWQSQQRLTVCHGQLASGK